MNKPIEESMRRRSFEETYPTRIRAIILAVILGLTVTFYLFPRFESNHHFAASMTFEEVMEEFDIPETRQFEAPPLPSRPSIPVESKELDIAEDITIEETGLESFEWEAPPPPPAQGPTVRFIPFDEPPYPIGGYEAILKFVEYPDIAREAGIEGTVILQVFVSRKGWVSEVVVFQGVPETGLDEAAINAVKRIRFKPAKQRDRPVGVWLSVPIHFRLQVQQETS